MARFPLFDVHQEGRSPRTSAQEHINVYCDLKPQGDRSQMEWHGRAGLEAFTTVIEAHPSRGMLGVENYLYTVHEDQFYRVNLAGTVENKGTLLTTNGRVDMASNGAEVLVVDGSRTGYLYTIATDTFIQLDECEFPDDPAAVTVDFEGGYFIITKEESGEFNISGLYDGTSWDPLEFATAEGFPDNLVRVIVEKAEVILFGNQSTEFWQNVGNVDFPYQRVRGGAIEFGLAARWSVADVSKTVMFLASNRSGEVQVVRLQGYQAVPVSTPDVDRLINSYAVVSDATGLSYTYDGHDFYQVNFPSAGKSWLFDNNTGMWSELQYGTEGARHRAEISTKFGNDIILSDYETGALYKQSPTTYADDGVSFAKQIQSRHVHFEKEMHISKLWVDFEPGAGLATGQGDDPQCMLSVSRDGGHTFGPERWTSIGKRGAFATRAIWRRLGRAYNFVFRIRVSDAVKFVVTNSNYLDAR